MLCYVMDRVPDQNLASETSYSSKYFIEIRLQLLNLSANSYNYPYPAMVGLIIFSWIRFDPIITKP